MIVISGLAAWKSATIWLTSEVNPVTTARASPGTMFSRRPLSNESNFSERRSNTSLAEYIPFSPLIIGKSASGEKPKSGSSSTSK